MLVRKVIWVRAVELMGLQSHFFSKFGTEVFNFFGQQSVFLEAVGFGSTAMAANATLLGAWGMLFVFKSFFQVLTWVVGD